MGTVEIKIRTINRNELPALLELYRHLHAVDAPLPSDDLLHQVWNDIVNDPRLDCLVAECDSKLIASCTLAIIPNLTRGARPYGLIENVVTHAEYRQKGVGTELLRHALQIAWAKNCYKVMLLTSSKREETHRFYERAGFRKGVKTGFVATQENQTAFDSRTPRGDVNLG
ncbi:MAG: GNAT family N-acetyltransferase [Chloroflexi bacterium]|nr:GNAT family N-acetyltransferase [Chloroflexota bacterium]